ncbi:MAG: MBL fold metallo-hydrolase [Desulfocapsa sp.]|nr:MBL fold metallo-hydrolase [Desulfocapsa sp.]
MRISFHGAARQVTGSLHAVMSGDDLVCLDCGMFQGKRQESREMNSVIPFDTKLISNILLSHAHIDHCGRIPLVTKQDGFNGHIICTEATADASEYLLKDSAKIQESDSSYLNYKAVKRFLYELENPSSEIAVSQKEVKKLKKSLKSKPHRLNQELIDELLDRFHLVRTLPLYTTADAERAIGYFQPTSCRQPVRVGKNMSATFYNAGHILGSTMISLRVDENSTSKTVLYTGDLGRYDKPIIKDPNREFNKEDREVDLLIMESTYGNRIHEPVLDLKPLLKEIIQETYGRGGVIMIPAFAYGRTQEIIYFLHELYLKNEVPKLPVYIDSPLATNLTTVFGEHPETYDEDTHETFLERGINPFSFPEIQYVNSVEESMKLNRSSEPHIVLAGSGMCEGGRILHHLRHRIGDKRNTILVVGYMAQNTLGRRILDLGLEYGQSGRQGKPPEIQLYGSQYSLVAEVKKLGGFSAHGDRDEMTRFLKESGLKIKKIAVVHGEEEQSLSFCKHLQQMGYQAFVPRQGESMEM